MPLLSLPNELLLDIAEFLDNQKHLHAVARSCRRLYRLLRHYLMRFNVQHLKGDALIWAARRDRRNFIRRLLRLGAQINTRGEPEQYGTPMHAAAKAGHLGMIELLLRKGGDSEAVGARGITPIFPALWARHEDIAILLFKKSQNPDTRIAPESGYTPLHVACIRQLPRSARVFLEHGASVHATTSAGETALHLALRPEFLSTNAVQKSSLELVLLLLQFGSRKDTTACILGLQHSDPRIRALWTEHQTIAYTPRKHQGGNVLSSIAVDVLDERTFPALNPRRAFQGSQLPTSTWTPSGIERVKEAVSCVGRTGAQMHRPQTPVEPFPKVIGRNSPHPSECTMQLLWRDLRHPKPVPFRNEDRNALNTEQHKTPQARKQKRWRSVQWN